MSYSAALIICSLLCGTMMPQVVVLATSSHVTRLNAGGESVSIEVQLAIKGNPFIVNPFLATRHRDSIGSRAAELIQAYENSDFHRWKRNKDQALRKGHSRGSREVWGKGDGQVGDRHSKTSPSSTPASLWPDTSVNNAVPALPRGDPDDVGLPKSTTPADVLMSAHGSVDSNEITETGGVGLSRNVSGVSHTGSGVQRVGTDVWTDGRMAGDDPSTNSTAQASGVVTVTTFQLTQGTKKGTDDHFTDGDSPTATGHSTNNPDKYQKAIKKIYFSQRSFHSQQSSVQEKRQDAPPTGQSSVEHAAAPPHVESTVQDTELTPVLKTATSTKNITVPVPRVKKPNVHKRPGDSPHAGTILNVDGGNYSATKLTLTLQSQDDSVTALWTFESNDTGITGFLVTYRINNREHYDSSKLGKLVRSFTLHSLHEDEDYVICVHAMVNTTAVVDACAHWNEASMKMVVGIMAGTLFLVPCIIVVIWILVKDSQIRNRMNKGVEARGAPYSKRLIAHDSSHHDGRIPKQHDGHSPKQHDGSHHCHAPHSDLEVSSLIVDGRPKTPNEKGLLRGASSSPKCNHPHHAVNVSDATGPWTRQSPAEQLEAESLVPHSLRPQMKTSEHSPAQAENHSSPICPRDHVALNYCASHGTPTSSDTQDTAGTKTTSTSHSSEDLTGSASVYGLNKPADSRGLSEPWFGLMDNEGDVHLDHQRVGQGASYLHIPPVLFDKNVIGKEQDSDMVAPL